MLLFVTVLLYGQTIGRSVLSEKTSKTVEIMLSSVRPIELLFGKILGNAAASMLQYGVWVSMTSLFIRILGPRLGVSMALGGSPTGCVAVLDSRVTAVCANSLPLTVAPVATVIAV